MNRLPYIVLPVCSLLTTIYKLFHKLIKNFKIKFFSIENSFFYVLFYNKCLAKKYLYNDF